MKHINKKPNVSNNKNYSGPPAKPGEISFSGTMIQVDSIRQQFYFPMPLGGGAGRGGGNIKII